MTPSWFLRVLRVQEPRMTGLDVDKVQRHLRVSEEGFGPSTAQKLRGLQWLVSLPQTGEVDAATAKKIGE